MISNHRRVLALLAVFGVAVLASAASAAAAVTTTVQYGFTGAAQTFVVPNGVTSIHILAAGARGGDNGNGSRSGGMGALVQADLPVTPGSVLTVMVGGVGGDGGALAGGVGGFNGGGVGGSGSGSFKGAGGGGGASDIRNGTTLATRLLIAAGGAGAGSNGAIVGGAAGDADSSGGSNFGPSDGGGGGGGSTLPGTAGTNPGANCGSPGVAGSPGQGGSGGDSTFGGANTAGGAGGGGGGGYGGGGGGGSGCNTGGGAGAGGGGGGGGSFADPSAKHVSPVGASGTLDMSGIPSVTITYVGPPPVAQLNHTSLTFSHVQPKGTVSAPKTVTVTNGGSAPLRVTGVAFAGKDPNDFMVDATSCMGDIAPGASCKISVRFAPQAQGARGGELQISDNGTSSPQTVALTGTGGPLPQGPPGKKGPRGKRGSPGKRGPAGKRGRRGHTTEVLLIGQGSFQARPGGSLSVRYASTRSASVTAELLRHGRLVFRTRITAKVGRNTLRIAHLPNAAGDYVLQLVASGAGQAGRDHARLKLSEPAPGAGGVG